MNMRWTLIEHTWDVRETRLIRRERHSSREMNALTPPEIAEIAAKVGCPRSMNNGKIALDVERIRAMRKAGFSWRQIADYLDVGVSTVRRRLRETDAPRYRTMIPTRNETANLPDLSSLPWLNPYK